MSIEVPKDPVELAAPFAEHMFTDPTFEGSAEDRRALAELDALASAAGLFGKYFLQAYRAIITPASFEADEAAKITVFDGLSVEGHLACFSRVSVGRVIGAGAIRALCITLDRGTLLPFFAPLEPTDLLHIPVLAVSSISRTD